MHFSPFRFQLHKKLSLLGGFSKNKWLFGITNISNADFENTVKYFQSQHC